MTRQETFDIVARHLLAQGEKSLGADGKCAYRGENGLKCAAGCLIPDELYDPSMEGLAAHTTAKTLLNDPRHAGKKPVAPVLEAAGHDPELARELQNIHDYVAPERWYTTLVASARRNGLSTAVLG